jgi:hypothetical protein
VAHFLSVPGGRDIVVERCESDYPEREGCPANTFDISGTLHAAWWVSVVLAAMTTLAAAWFAVKYVHVLLAYRKNTNRVQDMMKNALIVATQPDEAEPTAQTLEAMIAGYNDEHRGTVHDIHFDEKAAEDTQSKRRFLLDQIDRHHLRVQFDEAAASGGRWVLAVKKRRAGAQVDDVKACCQSLKGRLWAGWDKLQDAGDTVNLLSQVLIEQPVKYALGRSVRTFLDRECVLASQMHDDFVQEQGGTCALPDFLTAYERFWCVRVPPRCCCGARSARRRGGC